MIRSQEIADREKSMQSIVTLTTAFEGLASMRISQIKNQVLEAQHFFAELWNIYSQLRVDNLFRFGRHDSDKVVDKELYIAITAEGGFSGDIDQRLIKKMLSEYDPEKQDIIIIGHHGAVQLAQAGVKYEKYYKMPVKDQNTNIRPLVAEVHKYRTSYVYYQKYLSLMNQEIVRIELSKAVQEQGKAVTAKEDFISEANYIFEPSTFAVVAHLERSMLDISLSQTILDSKLAQYASRFRAMSAAKDRSQESSRELHTAFNRAKRMQSDERLKESINGLKKIRMVV